MLTFYDIFLEQTNSSQVGMTTVDTPLKKRISREYP